MSRSIFQVITAVLCLCLWSLESSAWSTDTIPPGSTHHERSTHALLADAAYSHFRRDTSYEHFLKDNYGIQGFDEFLKQVYGLEHGVDSSFHFASGLNDDSLGDGIAEYTQVDREFEAGRFERTLELPREIRDDAHELPWPFPVFQDLTARALPDLFVMGSMLEDNEFPRTDHHFHDPVRNLGLNQWLPRLWQSIFGIELSGLYLEYHDGASAVSRALGLDGTSRKRPANYYALTDAERYLFRTIVGERPAERETAAALHFLAFGHVLHLLQDMAQPAHVRNDSRVGHVLAKTPVLGKMIAPLDPVEEIAEKDKARDLITKDLQPSSELSLLASRPRAFLENFIQQYGATLDPILLNELNAQIEATEAQLPVLDASSFEPSEFFDRELNETKDYVPGSAFAPNHDSSAQNLGLAEFVNGEFFSDGTVGTTDDPFSPQFASPAIADLLPRSACQPLPFRHMDGSIDEIDGVPTFANAPEFSLFVTSLAVPHLLRCGYHAFTAEGKAEFLPESSDEAVLRDYFELLFPLAIQYQEEFMKAYFRPRLEVHPVGANYFQLVNLSPHRFVGDVASLEVVYEVDGFLAGTEEARNSVPVTDCVVDGGGSVFALEPAAPGEARGEPGYVTCTMPLLGDDDPEPAVGATLWMVARGQHGTRGEVGTPDEYDLAPENPMRKDFVTFIAKIPPPRIAFALGSDDERYDTDHRKDIFAVEVDFAGLERATEYVEPSIQNLTAPIRDALGMQEVDFYSSAMRPGSSEMALRTDLPFEPEVNEENHATGVTVINLAKSPVENARRLSTLGILPESRLQWNGSGIEPLRWSPDGAALFYQGTQGRTYRLRALQNGVGNGSLDRIAPLDQSAYGTGWNERCDQRDNFSPKSVDELVVESTCQRTTNPSNDEALILLEDSFLRHLQLVDDAPGSSTSLPVHYFDTNSGSIVDCPSTGVCLSNYAPGSFAGRQPHISPDGKRVAFFVRAGVCPIQDCGGWALVDTQLWIATLEGELAGQVQLMIENPRAEPVFYADPTNPHEYGILTDLAWSPDGNWLAFKTGTEYGRGNLYLLRADEATLASGVATPRLVWREIEGDWTRNGEAASLTWIPGLTLNRSP